jgi:threonine synthase
VAAGLKQLVAMRRIGAEETTVLVMTGSGLKATSRIAEQMGIVS